MQHQGGIDGHEKRSSTVVASCGERRRETHAMAFPALARASSTSLFVLWSPSSSSPNSARATCLGLWMDGGRWKT